MTSYEQLESQSMKEAVQTSEKNTENYIREIIFTLSVHIRLIRLIASVIFIIVICIVLFSPAKYTTSAKLMVSRKPVEGSISSLQQIDYRVEEVNQDDLNSEAQLLMSNDLLEKVIQKLHNEGVEFGDETELYQNNKQKWMEQRVDKLKASLVVEAIPYSKVLDVYLTWNSPSSVQLILKAIINDYLDYRVALGKPEDRADFFIELTDKYANRVNKGQKQLSDLIVQKNATSPAEEIKGNIEIQHTLKNKLAEAELKQIEIGQKIDVIKKSINSNGVQFFSFIDNESIRGFAKQIQEIAIKKAETAGVFLSDSKAVRELGQQMDEAYEKLLIEVNALNTDMQSQQEGLKLQIININDKIAALSQRNMELKQLEFAMGSIEKENNMLGLSFETFFKRKEEASLSNNKTVSNAEVVMLSSPRKPLDPSFPTASMIPFGFFLAIGVGVIIGFLTEFFDHTFKRPEDIERVLGVNHLMSINNT